MNKSEGWDLEWNKEEFIAETAALFPSEAHLDYLKSRLPNDGEDLQKICDEGMAQHKANFSRLFADITRRARCVTVRAIRVIEVKKV